MSDTWATRDIGRATSSVLLGVFSAEGYDKTGMNNTSSGFGGYQECWVSQSGSQLLQPYERIWPSDQHASNKWDSIGHKWRPVPNSFNAICLGLNNEPDAPLQTICRGRIGKDVGDIPLYRVDESLEPEYFVDAIPDTGPEQPASDAITTSFVPYYPSMNGDSGGAIPTSIKKNTQLSTSPFKPSSLDHLNTQQGSSGAAQQRVIDQLNNGIRLWNVWDIIYPAPSWDKRQYLRNFGPIYGEANSYGPIIRQSGSAGNMSVEVIANRGHATVARMRPAGYDIGRDSSYDWIFPYEYDGVIHHEISKPNTSCEISPDFDPINTSAYDADPPNIGFVLDISVSTGGGERSSFFGSPGSTPSVQVEWGSRSPMGASPQYEGGESGPFLRGFTAHLTPGKQPFLMFHNGDQLTRVFLSTSPVPQDIGHISLVVEYFGLAMYVTLNGNPSTCIRGYMPSGDKKYGIYVQPNNVFIHVTQCSIQFQFMPTYYDGWDPSIRSNFSVGQLTPGKTPENPVRDFFNNDLGAGEDRTFEGGQCKIVSISNFKIDPGSPSTTNSRVTSLIEVMISNLVNQSPTGPQMAREAYRWRLSDNGGSGTGPPFFQQDEGHIPLIRDSRMVECPKGGTSGLPIVCWSSDGTYLANWYDANSGASGSSDLYNNPIMINDTQTSVSVMFRTNVTHTTPLIFGFKAHNTDRRYGWYPELENWYSLDDSLERWAVEWKSDVTTAGGRPGGAGKVLKASASINLLNPDPRVIKAIVKNQMRIRICNTGYVQNAMAVTGGDTSSPLYKVLHRSGIVFEGVTTGCVLTKEPGGQVSLEVMCEDPITMLEQAIMECNIRCDGLSYLMAFSEVFRTTDYSDRLIIKMNPEVRALALSPKWTAGTAAGAVAGRRSDEIGTSLYNMIFFGYHPMHANSFELSYGDSIYETLKRLLSIMHNPAHLPLFYYDPNETITGRNNFGAFKLTRRGMNSDHVTIYEQGGVDVGLPLLANPGEKGYSLSSSTASLRSHFVVIGTDRITGTATKGCYMNPNWNRLYGQNLDVWSETYGHMGYRSKVIYSDIQPMMTDSSVCKEYAKHAMWWLMRPPMKIENLKVHGMIDPISVEDGCVNLVLGAKDKVTVLYNKAMLERSVINYDAKTERVTSQISVIIFPDEAGGGWGF